MSDPTEKDDESARDSALAAEYALRLLDGDELRMAEARASADPGFAREVAAWHEDLVTLTDPVAPVKPRRATKGAVMTRLFGEASRQGMWSAVGIWRGLALASMTATAGLALLMVSQPGTWLGTGTVERPGTSAPAPLQLAEIASEDGSLRLLAAYVPQTDTVEIRRVAGEARPGRALELWAIAGADAPVSLGLIGEGAQSVTLPAAVARQLAQTPLVLAISDEPAGGSPTGQPTGAVLAAGPVTTI